MQLLIDGELVDGARAIDLVNPADGQVFAAAPCADAAQVERAVAAGQRAFAGWRALDFAERGVRIAALADALEGRAEDFAARLTQEQGKPLAEARGEIEGAVAALRYHAGLRLEPVVLKDSATERVVEQRHPLGVVAAIVPWNYPLLLLALKLAPALIAGNVVIAKPAPTTPLTTLMLGALAADIFPAGVVQMLGDAGDVGPMLTAHPGIAHVSFTGSTATGRRVMAAAADTVKRFTLELGGNDPAILLDDADVATVAPILFDGAMGNAGQVCLGVKRIYAPRALMPALGAALVACAERAVVGDGRAAGTTIGPVQNAAQYARLVDLLAEARAQGRVLHGGAPIEGRGYYIAPTIVTDLPDAARLVQEEQFGPIIPLLAYDDEAELVRRVNDGPYGLGASVWTADAARGQAMAARIDSGLVWVNRLFDLPFDVPIGGAKQSGIGRHQGLAGVEEFTQIRIVNAALG